MGASLNPERISYRAIHTLRNYNHPVTAFGVKAGTVSDVEISTNFPTNQEFDTVTLYVGPQNQTELIDKVIALKPNRIIFNPGTENADFENKANAAGIETEEACTLVLLGSGQY